MKKVFYSIFIIFVLVMFFLPTIVNANIICNDGTVSPSCVDCHRGCCSHHGGCSSRSGTSSSSSRSSSSSSKTKSSTNNVTQQSPIKKEPKSSDVSLKKVTIDSENIDISDSMSYKTANKNVHIFVTANDDKAITEYKSNAELVVGNNVINIKVIAENGNFKNYKLNIIKENTLSNNKNIKIMIDDKEVNFKSFKSEIVYLSNDKNEVNIKYELEDVNAKAEIIGNKDLNVGKNEVIVRVTAENGEEQDYLIEIEKHSKISEIIPNIICFNFVIGFFGGIGYLIYYIVNQSKKKQIF